MDAKIRDTLLKLRKRATSNLNAGAFVSALTAIGWKTEQVLTLRRNKHYLCNGASSHKFPERVMPFQPMIKADAETVVGLLLRVDGVRVEGDLVVPPAGMKLRRGERYFSDVTIQVFDEGTLIEALDWVADKATRITAADGGQIDLFAKSPSSTIDWAYRHGLEEAVCALLEMPTVDFEKRAKEAERARERDQEGGRGTCPICGNRIMRNLHNKMWAHGYKRPGDGCNHGNCPGVGHDPYEISDEGCVAYRDLLLGTLEVTRAYLASLEADQVEELAFEDFHGVRVYSKSNPKHLGFWDRLRQDKIREVEAEIRGLEGDVLIMEQRIQDWRPLPLA